MENLYCFEQKGTDITYPRFWVRFIICLLVGFEIFWYTSNYGADFGALFSQGLSIYKLILCGLASVLIGEWIFYSCAHICQKIDLITHKKKFITVMVIAEIILPYLFMYGFGKTIILFYGKEMETFVSSINLMNIFLIMANFIMINTAIYLFQRSRYIQNVEATYGGQNVILQIRNIAYLFYHKGTYFITTHNGINYETELRINLEQFNELLNPKLFFMINDFTIISRKACTDYKEDENGQIIVNLTPKPIIPKPLRDVNAHDLFDFLNYN